MRAIPNNYLCTSCGACSYICKNKVLMRKTRKAFRPDIKAKLSFLEINTINAVCPAKGYSIYSLGKKLFENAKYDFHIGSYIDYFVAKSNNSKTLLQSSSGGVMTELAIYLLNNHIVKGVIATSFRYEGTNIVPFTSIITESAELYKCQGSKYMPIPTLTSLSILEDFDGDVAYIGTPCQIATIRQLNRLGNKATSKIRFLIGNFCGGYRDLREQRAFLKVAKMNNSNINNFQYRGGGQPGFMKIFNQLGEMWEYPYPDYSRLTGYIKMYRCRVCLDATAELADISCGDAWIPDYNKNDNQNWSAVIIRNNELYRIIQKMIEEDIISKESLTFEQLISSQKQNLNSKKDRFLSRKKFFSRLCIKSPDYDGGWNPINNYKISFEFKVFASEMFKYVLYILGLLHFFNKLKNKSNDK